jgi:hypothetical protein
MLEGEGMKARLGKGSGGVVGGRGVGSGEG